MSATMCAQVAFLVIWCPCSVRSMSRLIWTSYLCLATPYSVRSTPRLIRGKTDHSVLFAAILNSTCRNHRSLALYKSISSLSCWWNIIVNVCGLPSSGFHYKKVAFTSIQDRSLDIKSGVGVQIYSKHNVRV